jgi:aminopeptidase YwaD
MVERYSFLCQPSQIKSKSGMKAGRMVLIIFLWLTGAYTAVGQQLDYARKVVNTLASPAFKGRGYVEKGDQLTAAFIAKEFKSGGLTPINNGSYYQDFNLPVNTFPGKVEVKLNNQLLQTAVDYLVDASSPAVKGDFKVISAKRSDINSAEKLGSLVLKARGYFILLDNRPAEDETSEDKDMIAQNVAALKINPALDFKGLLLFSNDKLTWTVLPFQSIRPVITINKKGLDPVIINSVSLDIEAKFIAAYSTRNVAAMVKGTAGSDSTLVLTAHYDHLGLLGKKVYFPGANDNASGVAMLLSLANYYAKHPQKYNMVFIAFSGEEIGLLGSRAFIEQPLIDLSKIKFLVNFDLAGTGDEGIKVVNGTKFKANFDKLQQLNQQYQLLPKVEIRGEACNSDHCLFYAKGVPSFFIYTQGGIQAYHDIYDKAETLPLTKFEPYFQLMIKFFDSGLW